MISVIIPTYKRLNELERAIKSVLSQRYHNFEILIVNDYCDEATVKQLIREINDDRIRYFNNERKKGANGARNTGILHSKGEYIAFLDDDDELLPSKFSTQIKHLKTKSEKWGGVFGSYLSEKKNSWNIVKYENLAEVTLKDVILNNISICSGSNLIIKKEAIEKVGLWDEDLFRQQDLEFLLRFLSKYKLAYDINISLKIYGHNTPNPIKAFTEREKYLQKILNHLELLSKQDLKKFYSNHYRRQAKFLVMQREFRQSYSYWLKAIKYCPISIRKDIRLILLLLKYSKLK